MAQVDLSKILTSSLYERVLSAHFPFPIPIDVATVGRFSFLNDPDHSKQSYDACFTQALQPMSTMVPNVPSLTAYLPPRDSREFPKHVLGLFGLIDQSTRLLFQGSNARYSFGYFDRLSQKLVQDLMAEGTFPDDISRWMGLGYPYEDAILRMIWLYVPLIHSESLDTHRYMEGKVEDMRKDVEKYTGMRDPFRETREKDMKDLFLFRKVLLEEPIPETFGPLMFWIFKLFEAHRPLIEKFGRYPYRNDVVGRDSTEEEERFLRDSEGFGQPELTKEQVKRIKELAERGQWDPLGDVKPGWIVLPVGASHDS